jgi:hypothetical protein
MLKKMAARPQNKTSRGGAHDPPARPSMWRCPECGRQFANRNQSHACGRFTLASHFQGKPPTVRAIFDKVLRIAKRNGPVTVLPEKTRIAFQVRMSFAAFVIRRNWSMATSCWRVASKIPASSALKRSRREIICMLSGSKASRTSMPKSPPGWPRLMKWANSYICADD